MYGDNQNIATAATGGTTLAATGMIGAYWLMLAFTLLFAGFVVTRIARRTAKASKR